jgi:AraC family transcriptional regulator
MKVVLPTAPDATVLLSCVRDSRWYGFPFQVSKGPEAGEWNDCHLPAYKLSLIINGQCSSRIGTKQRQHDLTHPAGTFAAYPAGRHWDILKFRGPVTAISVACEWGLLRKSRLLDADDLPRLVAIHPCASDAGLTSIIFSMVREYESGSPSGRLYAESLSLALAARLHGIAREVGRRNSVEEGLGRQRARLVQDFIEANLGGDLSVADLARSVGISPTRFANLFRNTFSVPVHRYVVNRRMERAMSMLLTNNYRNAEIATACGFASESHLSGVFKRIVGATPRNFRLAGQATHLENIQGGATDAYGIESS